MAKLGHALPTYSPSSPRPALMYPWAGWRYVNMISKKEYIVIRSTHVIFTYTHWICMLFQSLSFEDPETLEFIHSHMLWQACECGSGCETKMGMRMWIEPSSRDGRTIFIEIWEYENGEQRVRGHALSLSAPSRPFSTLYGCNSMCDIPLSYVMARVLCMRCI